MKKNKADTLFIALLIAACVYFMFHGHKGEKKLYLIKDNIKSELPMERGLIKLNNGKVIIETSAEGARFIESNCPNKICIKEGWVKKCGDTAVCVPNRIALVIECKEQDYDAISQ